MLKNIKGKIKKETKEGTYFTVLVEKEKLSNKIKNFTINKIFTGELRIDDGREITNLQRKKIYATINDMGIYLGYNPYDLKEIMKYNYMAKTGAKYFSLSNCSIEVSIEFINYLLEFCLEWQIPLKDNISERTEDIDKAMYICIKYKKCVVCGNNGEIHHVDAIGMGRDRKKVNDSNMRKMCLCRKHHSEIHKIGLEKFNKKYKVYGILFNV